MRSPAWLCFTLPIALSLVGCASNPTTTPGTVQAPVAQAVTAPLGDLNLVRTDIPPVLQQAAHAPYALPPGYPACDALLVDTQALTVVLGPDLDVAPTSSDSAAAQVENAALDAVRGAAEGVIPFRGWVRKLSGAERHQKDVEAAIRAGTVRRAFLKGLSTALHCPPPAPAAPVASSAPASR